MNQVPKNWSEPAVHRGEQTPAAPLFSIIVPCFELGVEAHDAVESALSQTFQSVEVIVVDDGSSTPVAHHLQPFLQRIVLVRQQNGGISSARNTGIALARGRFIVLLDGDDLLLPAHCAACLQLFESDPTCAAAAPDAWIFGEGRPEGTKLSELYPRSLPITLEGFLTGKTLVPGWCTFKREVFDRVSGPYDVAFRRAEDFRLNTQLLIDGVKFSFLPEVTYRYRKRAGSLSFDNPIPLVTAVVEVIEKLQIENASNPDVLRLLRRAHERYSTDLHFHHFRKALLARAYADAARHARAVRTKYLQPSARRWKFMAARIVAMLLARTQPRPPVPPR